ncbi:DedA family protein [Flaviaesturariibacter amylovorans]|uniref:VTT domain-containing protein n=1 Tax=Flaviaesturariibacter amylovorans TaxID=1084520 RepID=A0ABP8HCR5_9BACT
MTLLFGTSDLIAWGGVFLIALLIYAETGLLLGLIVPGGETLLFSAGIIASADGFGMRMLPLLLLLIAAGLLGDSSGYLIGRKLGPKLYHKKDTWYFKKKLLHSAERFFREHRTTALFLGKFLPVVRPFMPLLGGITRVRPSVLLPLSYAAVVLHICFFFLGGYYLGGRFPGIKQHLSWILPVSLAVLLIPVIVQVRKNRSEKA